MQAAAVLEPLGEVVLDAQNRSVHHLVYVGKVAHVWLVIKAQTTAAEYNHRPQEEGARCAPL